MVRSELVSLLIESKQHWFNNTNEIKEPLRIKLGLIKSFKYDLA